MLAHRISNGKGPRMTGKPLRVQVESAEDVAVVRFANPPHGTVSNGGAADLVAAIRPLLAAAETRAIILTGGQDGIFIRHADVRQIATSLERVGMGSVDPQAFATSAFAELGAMLDEGQVLISGGLRRERAARPGERDRVFNSLLLFGRGEPAKLIGSYDKIHLVPFGEYLPFQRVLEWIGLEQLSRLRGGFASASWPRRAISVPGLGNVVPLICYEAIFPAAIYAGNDRPRALLNVTNDGWFGDSIGPRQHFHQARVRAVEEGLPMIRAANNGISAVFDGLGRVRGRLEMNERGAFAVELPNAVYATPYSKYGDKIFFAMFAMLGLVAIVSWRRGKKSGPIA